MLTGDCGLLQTGCCCFACFLVGLWVLWLLVISVFDFSLWWFGSG